MHRRVVFRKVAIAAILIFTTMQAGLGTADTATSYDFASTTRWERINDGYWSPNQQTPPLPGSSGSVSTGAIADKDTGVLGATATAVSNASAPFLDQCALTNEVNLQPISNVGFGGFFCIQKGVKHGLAKSFLRKTLNLPIIRDSNGSPFATHTVTVTVDTSYVVPEGSGPSGLHLCYQIPVVPPQVPAQVRPQVENVRNTIVDTCWQASASGIDPIPRSEGSSFVMLSAWTFFENGSSGDPSGEKCEQDPQCEIRSTPNGHPEDFPPSELAKWLYPGVTQFQLQVHGYGPLSVFVELQASAYARGIGDASAACTLDVISIEAVRND